MVSGCVGVQVYGCGSVGVSGYWGVLVCRGVRVWWRCVWGVRVWGQAHNSRRWGRPSCPEPLLKGPGPNPNSISNRIKSRDPVILRVSFSTWVYLVQRYRCSVVITPTCHGVQRYRCSVTPNRHGVGSPEYIQNSSYLTLTMILTLNTQKSHNLHSNPNPNPDETPNPNPNTNPNPNPNAML